MVNNFLYSNYNLYSLILVAEKFPTFLINDLLHMVGQSILKFNKFNIHNVARLAVTNSYLIGGFTSIVSLLWIFLFHESPDKHSSISEKERNYIKEQIGSSVTNKVSEFFQNFQRATILHKVEHFFFYNKNCIFSEKSSCIIDYYVCTVYFFIVRALCLRMGYKTTGGSSTRYYLSCFEKQ